MPMISVFCKSAFEFCFDLILYIKHTLQKFRIECTAFAAEYHTYCLFMRKRSFIYTFADKRIIYVCYRYDLCGYRYLIALEPVGITSAVITLVMPATYGIRHLDKLFIFILFELFEHIRTYHRMCFHYGKLLFGKSARLV